MRINIYNKSVVDTTSELCDIYKMSPTQLFIHLVQEKYDAHTKGCTDEETYNKNNIHRPSN